MAAESEDYEEKSVYTGSQKEKLELIKTIVAMANTAGGSIKIYRVSCSLDLLDSARIDDAVNRYVGPPLHGIASMAQLDGSVLITVTQSKAKPHVFEHAVEAEDSSGKRRPVFHAGQLWIRHSSKTVEGRGTDIERLVREAAGNFIEEFGVWMRNPNFFRAISDGDAPAYRITNDQSAPGATLVDPTKTHPLRISDVAKLVDRPGSWVRAAADRLGILGNILICFEVKARTGRVTARWFTVRFLELIQRQLSLKPTWDPQWEEAPDAPNAN